MLVEEGQEAEEGEKGEVEVEVGGEGGQQRLRQI